MPFPPPTRQKSKQPGGCSWASAQSSAKTGQPDNLHALVTGVKDCASPAPHPCTPPKPLQCRQHMTQVKMPSVSTGQQPRDGKCHIRSTACRHVARAWRLVWLSISANLCRPMQGVRCMAVHAQLQAANRQSFKPAVHPAGQANVTPGITHLLQPPQQPSLSLMFPWGSSTADSALCGHV